MEKGQFNNDLVSVIVPVYNAMDYLDETMQSILEQSYGDIEIICIDDMSSDGSREKILDYATKYDRVKPILLEKNMGVAEARNKGIEAARGRFIAFLDSDDLWLPEKIKKQVKFMKDNNYGFTFTSYRFIDSNSDKLNTIVHAKPVLTYNRLLKQNAISCLTVVIDRNIIGDISMPKIRHEDYAAWLKILKKGHKAYGLDEVLALYRKRQNSLSGNKLKAASWTWNILRNEEGIGLIRSAYYFCYYALVNIFKHFFGI